MEVSTIYYKMRYKVVIGLIVATVILALTFQPVVADTSDALTETEESVATLSVTTIFTLSVIAAFAICYEACTQVPMEYRPSFLGLGLYIISPKSGSFVTETSTTVEGVVSSPDAAVTINGKSVKVTPKFSPFFQICGRFFPICAYPFGIGKYGIFSADIDVSRGENKIAIIAELDQNKKTETRTITKCTEKELRLYEAERAVTRAEQRLRRAESEVAEARYEVDKAISDVKQASRRVEYAQRDLDRALNTKNYELEQKARERLIAEKSKLESARSRLDAAEATLDSARAEVDLAIARLKDARDVFKEIKNSFSPEEIRQYEELFKFK